MIPGCTRNLLPGLGHILRLIWNNQDNSSPPSHMSWKGIVCPVSCEGIPSGSASQSSQNYKQKSHVKLERWEMEALASLWRGYPMNRWPERQPLVQAATSSPEDAGTQMLAFSQKGLHTRNWVLVAAFLLVGPPWKKHPSSGEYLHCYRRP